MRDSYLESKFRETRQTKGSVVIPIRAFKGDVSHEFRSLTQCAQHFNVDRSSIVNRLDNGKQLDGWTFTQVASSVSND